MKKLVILLIFVLLASVAQAECKLYIGQNDLGQGITGMEISIAVMGARIGYDIQSTIFKANSIFSYTPDTVVYKAYYKYRGLEFGHICTHALDSFSVVAGDKNYIKVTMELE